MNTVEIRQKIQEYVNKLSPERLLVAADFLAYLAEREDNEATEEAVRNKQPFYRQGLMAMMLIYQPL